MGDIEYYLGMLAGLLVGVVVCWLLLRKRKREYDERQKAAQGIAYRAAYATLMLYIMLVSTIQRAANAAWLDPFSLSITGIILSISVMAIICILKDAYLPLKQTVRQFYGMIAAVMAANLAGALGSDDPLLRNGQLTGKAVNWLVVILYAVIIVVYTVKLCYDRRHEADE